MNWLDMLIVAILAITMLMGFWRGLISTIFPLVGIILGIVLAGRFYNSLADWLFSWLGSAGQAKIAGFAIIFIVVLIASMVLAWILRKFLSLLFLGWVDRLGGLVLGLAIGGLVIGALLSLVIKADFPSVGDAIRDSVLASFFLDHFPFKLAALSRQFDATRQFHAGGSCLLHG